MCHKKKWTSNLEQTKDVDFLILKKISGNSGEFLSFSPNKYINLTEVLPSRNYAQYGVFSSKQKFRDKSSWDEQWHIISFSLFPPLQFFLANVECFFTVLIIIFFFVHH